MNLYLHNGFKKFDTTITSVYLNIDILMFPRFYFKVKFLLFSTFLLKKVEKAIILKTSVFDHLGGFIHLECLIDLTFWSQATDSNSKEF